MSDENNTEVTEESEENEPVFVKPRIAPDVVVKYLNELFEADSEAVKKLVEHRVDTNQSMMDHDTVCVMVDNDENGNPANPQLGLLGVINGLVGISKSGWHYIAAEFDEEGSLHRFLEVPQAMEELEEEKDSE